MSYKLEFEIAGLPKMANGSHKSWRAAAAEKKKWKRASAHAAIVAGVPKNPLAKAKLTLTRHSARQSDFDGLVAGFKNVIDGLKEAGVIVDDKMSVIGIPVYQWQKAKKNEGKVTVKVEACNDIP